MRPKMNTIVLKMKGREGHRNLQKPCFFRIRESSNPREKDLVLVNTPARRHKLGCYCFPCLSLRVHVLRALLTSAHECLSALVATSHPESVPLSRIYYLIPNRKPHHAMVSPSTQRSISDSTHHKQNIFAGSTAGIPCPANPSPHFGRKGTKSWRYDDLIFTFSET